MLSAHKSTAETQTHNQLPKCHCDQIGSAISLSLFSEISSLLEVVFGTPEPRSWEGLCVASRTFWPHTFELPLRESCDENPFNKDVGLAHARSPGKGSSPYPPVLVKSNSDCSGLYQHSEYPAEKARAPSSRSRHQYSIQCVEKRCHKFIL